MVSQKGYGGSYVKELKKILRLFLYVTTLITVLSFYVMPAYGQKVETLYNGIELPAKWLPYISEYSFDPMPLPYLESPPRVIPIDVGRQLFVDDFLIEETTMIRTHHKTEEYPGNPVLSHEKAWEKKGKAPTAMPFSDGVWWDPQDKWIKMWYIAGYCEATAYATSTDGLNWSKPMLEVMPGTNIVHTWRRDSNSVVLDYEARDPQKRFWLFQFHRDPNRMFGVHHSPLGPLSKIREVGFGEMDNILKKQ